jgi:hypothetical protein
MTLRSALKATTEQSDDTVFNGLAALTFTLDQMPFEICGPSLTRRIEAEEVRVDGREHRTTELSFSALCHCAGGFRPTT